MSIAVDAMGGDRAPFVVVQGAVEAAREHGVPVILVGDAEIVRAELAKYDTAGLPISVKHADEVIGMGESPSQAVRRKKKSSIWIGVELVKSGEAEAFVSAGNTGAAMAASVMSWGTLAGVERPAIIALLPTLSGVTAMLDVGATVDCKPKHLVQFAVMGDVYARCILKRENPKVALLSIGEEAGKGNDVIRETFSILKRMPINFIGNVDGKEVYKAKADVVVCDGFIGNVALKISESLAEMIHDLLRAELTRTWRFRLGALLLKPAFANFKKSVDYSEYGGAPLLGVDGICIIGHGSSTAKAIKNAIRIAAEFSAQKVNERIVADLAARTDLRDFEEKTVPFWSHVKEKTRAVLAERVRRRIAAAAGSAPAGANAAGEADPGGAI
jgi:glycerol-3-phosphate acyltransferase PlsX